jgi:hypothetical protein
MLVSSSPKRFVGNYVLLRLCVPRYPPLALCSLTFFSVGFLHLTSLSFSMQFSRFSLDFHPAFLLSQDLDAESFFLFFGLFNFLVRWAILDLNQRPHGYQPCALTSWANSPCLFFISWVSSLIPNRRDSLKVFIPFFPCTTLGWPTLFLFANCFQIRADSVSL